MIDEGEWVELGLKQVLALPELVLLQQHLTQSSLDIRNNYCVSTVNINMCMYFPFIFKVSAKYSYIFGDCSWDLAGDNSLCIVVWSVQNIPFPVLLYLLLSQMWKWCCLSQLIVALSDIVIKSLRWMWHEPCLTCAFYKWTFLKLPKI